MAVESRQTFSRNLKRLLMRGLYRFGQFEIDALRRELRRNGEPVPLSGKPFDVLLVLVAHPAEVLSKDDLLQAVWPDSFVEEANLTQSISVIRKALGETAAGSRYIVTVPGRGYQLAVVPALVEAQSPAPPALLAAPPAAPPATPSATLAPPLSAAASPGNHTRRTMLLGILTGLALLAAAGLTLWHAGRAVPFAHATLRPLTNSGDLRTAAIAPSGRFVAWTSAEPSGQESLSVLDLSTGRSRALLRTQHEVFDDLTFSPGEGFLYYRSHTEGGQVQVATEYRLPLLGGDPAPVLRDIDSPPVFVDHGTRLCFLRESASGRFAFFTADAEDGGNEQVLARSDPPAPLGAACSPDGRRAILSFEVGGLAVLDFVSGRRSAFYDNSHEREVFIDPVWSGDGTAILASSTTPLAGRFSLWRLSYPGARLTRISEDLASYRLPTIAADSRVAVALRSERDSEFHSISLPLPSAGPETESLRWSGFLGWRDDHTLVGTDADGGLKLTDIHTGETRLLPIPANMHFLQPNGCGQQGLVAAGSRQPHQDLTIWFVRPDGSGLRQLSHGREDILPACTADGQWVVYADSSAMRTASIYRVSPGGGAAVKVGGNSVWFAPSFRTHQLAWFDEPQKGLFTIAISNLDTGRRLLTVPLPLGMEPSRGLSWSPDDRHLFFIVHGATADAIWRCSLDGLPPVKVVEVPGQQVAAVLASPGGARLGFVTSRSITDAVLIQSTNP